MRYKLGLCKYPQTCFECAKGVNIYLENKDGYSGEILDRLCKQCTEKLIEELQEKVGEM